MKKTKQIDTYYCDYCGKECAQTPEYFMPEIRKVQYTSRCSKNIIRPSQKDICPVCQKQIAKLINLLHYADFVGDDMEKIVYVLLKKSKA